VEDEALISRAEVEAMLRSIHDINANVGRLIRFLERGDDGEEEQEDDLDA
jgi:hypothetical protein